MGGEGVGVITLLNIINLLSVLPVLHVQEKKTNKKTVKPFYQPLMLTSLFRI